MTTAFVIFLFVVLPTVRGIFHRVDDVNLAKFHADLARFQAQQKHVRKAAR